jgi:hypothetical protein
LRNKQASKREYDTKCDGHNRDDGQTSGEMPTLQKSNDGREDETQEDRKSDGYQNFARNKKKCGDQGYK